MLRTKKIGNVIEIYLSGRLDVHLSLEIEKEIHQIIERETSHLLLNLEDVDYMSSSGIRIFVSSLRLLQNTQRKLKICRVNSIVKKIFEIVELMDMFSIYNTEAEALEAFKTNSDI